MCMCMCVCGGRGGEGALPSLRDSLPSAPCPCGEGCCALPVPSFFSAPLLRARG